MSAIGPTERDTVVTTPEELLGAWDEDGEEPTQPTVATLLRGGAPEPLGDVVARVLADAARGER